MTDAALGNLMLRLSDAKRRQATLMAHLHEVGRILSNFGDNLRYVNQEAPPFPEGYPERAIVKGMLDDLRAVCQDIALAHTQLADAGIDVS